MKTMKSVLFLMIAFVMCMSAFSVNAAFASQKNDVKLLCDMAVQYVNSGSEEVFELYIADGIEDALADGQIESSKFRYLFDQDPMLEDVEENQLSKIVAVLKEVYVNGGDAVLTQDDINEDVTPGHSAEANNPDYQEDDAETFMNIINKNKEMLNPVSTGSGKGDGESKKDAMPPETNKDSEENKTSDAGVSVGIVILISIIVSAIVYAALAYALKQTSAKKRGRGILGEGGDDDEVYNLRLAVKSMQTSLQKADGNFKELDKLRVQVDEIDEKLEHITEYLRKLNKTE